MNNKLQLELREQGYEGDFVLSELIEACGDGFAGLIKRGKKYDAGKGSDQIPNNEAQCRYFSPEEAVAKLWIELNKKQ